MKKKYLLVAQGVCILLAIILAMSDKDEAAWIIMNGSILIGLIGPIPAWYYKKQLVAGFGIAYLKICLTLFLAWGWWTFNYDNRMPYEHAEFFWLMSPFLLILGIFETSIIDSPTKSST